MGRKEVQKAVTAAGLPCCHMAWLEGQAPPLPWCVFYLDDTDGVFADNTVRTFVNRWVVELYQKSADAALENALEQSLLDAFGPFIKSETWVRSENCLQTAYHFTEID